MGRLVKRTSVPVAADGSVRLAVVSDTHSQPHPAMTARLAEGRDSHGDAGSGNS